MFKNNKTTIIITIIIVIIVVIILVTRIIIIIIIVLFVVCFCESNTRCAVLQYRLLLDRKSKWAEGSLLWKR